MDPKDQLPKGRDGVLTAFNMAIEHLNLAKISSIAPAKAVFGSTSVLLAVIRVSFSFANLGDLLAH